MASGFELVIDWEGLGVGNAIPMLMAGGYDDVTTDVRAEPEVSCQRGMDQVKPLATIKAGTFDAELDNQSRRYSTENTASPLYGNLVPGRLVQLRYRFESAGTAYDGSFPYDSASVLYDGTTYFDLWVGYLDDLPQHPDQLQRSVSIPALGPLSRFAKKQISTALYQSIRTDQAIGYILDALKWPAGQRVIDVGQTTLDWWWLDSEDALAAMQTILNTEGPGARLYEDGSGNIVFESRYYRFTTPRCTTSQATFNDGTPGHTAEPVHSTGFVLDPDLKDVVNVCTLDQKTRSIKTQEAIWKAPDTFVLGAGEVRKFPAQASGDPFMSAVTPVFSSADSQQISIVGTPTGGTFTLTFKGQTTTPLNWNATALQVQTALLALSSIGATNIACSGGPLPSTPIVCTFAGSLLAVSQTLIGHSDLLTGGSSPSISVMHVTDGVIVNGSIDSVVIDRTSGQTVTITVTAGAGGGTLAGLQLRASPVTVDTASQVANTLDMSANIQRNGSQPFNGAVRAEVGYNVLQDLANSYVSWFSSPRPQIKLVLIADASAVDSRFINALNRKISDRITVYEAQTGLNSDCFIESIDYSIRLAGRMLQVRFGLEKRPAAPNYFVLDTSVLDGGDMLAP